MSFKFKLKSRVKLSESEEQGDIVGRAEYSNGNENAYWVCYKAGDGRQIERWWNESQLIAVTKTRAKKTK